jgi:hypothetical protein
MNFRKLIECRESEIVRPSFAQEAADGSDLCWIQLGMEKKCQSSFFPDEPRNRHLWFATIGLTFEECKEAGLL